MFNKLYMAVFGALVMAGYQLSQTGDLGTPQYIQMASAGIGAFLVWLTANGPKGSAWAYAKTAAIMASAVLPTVITVLPGGLNTHEVFVLLVSALTAAGVYQASGSPIHPEKK